MELEQQERAIYAASCEGEDITPEIRKENQPFMLNLTLNLEGMQWCVNTFDSFQYSTSHVFALGVVSYWCREKWLEMEQETIEFIRKFLFQSLIENYEKYPDIVADKLADAQTQYVLNSYPSLWPDFWDFIFSQNDTVLTRFLIAFCNELASRSPITLNAITSIRENFVQTGIISTITQFMFQKINNNELSGYMIAAQYCQWGDISWVTDIQSFNSLALGLTNDSSLPYVLTAYNNIIGRPIDDSIKDEIICSLPEKLIQIANSYAENPEIIDAAAELTAGAGIISRVPELNKSELFYEIALQYFHISKTAALKVIGYLCIITSLHPDFAVISMKNTFLKLNSLFTFESPNILHDILTVAQRFIQLAITSFQVNQSDIKDELKDIIIEFDFSEDLAATATLIYILTQILMLTETMVEGWHIILDLIALNLPMTPQYFLALKFLLDFFNGKPDKIPNEIMYLYIHSLIRFVISDEIEPFYKKEFSRQLNSITAKRVLTFIEIDFDTIGTLLQTFNPALVSISTHLVTKFNEETQYQLISQYLNFFIESLNSSENSGAIAEASLKFITDCRFPKSYNTHLIEQSQNLLKITSQYISLGDSILAVYISAIYKIDGFDKIMSCFQELLPNEKPKSLKSICICILTHLKYCINHKYAIDIQSCFLVLSALFPIINTFIENSLIIGLRNSTDFKHIATALIYYLSFAGKLFHQAYDQIDQELFDKIINFVKYLFDRMYDSPIAIHSCISFLTEICKFNEVFVAQTFLLSTFNFLLSKSFSPYRQEWEKVISQLHLFHQTILRKNYDLVAEILVSVFQDLGVPDPKVFLDTYNNADEKRVFRLKTIYQDLMVYFQSNDI